MPTTTRSLAAAAILAWCAPLGAGQDRPAPARPAPLPQDLVEALPWRSIGPTNMGGRVCDVAVVESRPQVFYLAMASGGIYKTVTHGTTFTPVFDGAGMASVGAVAVAPSDPKVVWAGTGEANARNSVSWGDGVWKSVDGGKSWSHMGLQATHHIGRIVIHPEDPDVVYVAAAGRTWADHPARGLYQTTDGGRTWRKVLAVDSATGVIDVIMHPRAPDTLIAAAYERQRDGFDNNDPVRRWGPGSALYKTSDGGKSWQRLSGPDEDRGLPTVAMGRCGLAWSRSDPRVVYASIETELIGKKLEGGVMPVSPRGGAAYMGLQGEDAGSGGAYVQSVVRNTAAATAGLEQGDVILEAGGKKIDTWDDMVAVIRAHKAGDTITLKWLRGQQAKEGPLTFGARGGPRNPDAPYAGSLGGQRAGMIKYQGPRGWEQGGIYRSDDGGKSWDRVNSLNERPFYFSQIRVAPSDPNDVWHLGIRLYRSRDGGKSWHNAGGRSHVDYHAMWIDPRDPDHVIMGSDGGAYVAWDGRTWDHLNTVVMGQFYGIALDNRTPYHIYGGLQDNGSWGGPSRVRSTAGATQSDWRLLQWGDGFRCAVEPGDDGIVYAESQYGRVVRHDLRSGTATTLKRPNPRQDANEKGRSKLRFNWNTPYLISPHDPKRLWVGAQRVLVADDRSDTLTSVSDDLSLTDAGSLTALAEDRFVQGVLYAGSDDGALQVSRDGGATWTDRFAGLPGLAGRRWIGSIAVSHHVRGTAFVVVDGHRSDDFEPHCFVTRDFGGTFERIDDGLPAGVPVRVLREDPRVRDLLYCGTERGLYVRLPGEAWRPLGTGLPVVPVLDLQIHPRDHELVAATHGRSLWILNVAPLQERLLLPEGVVPEVALLGASHPVVALDTEPKGALAGVRHFTVGNPPPVELWLRLPVTPARGLPLVIEVRNAQTDAVVRRLEPPRTNPLRKGWNRITWDLRGMRMRNGRPTRGAGPVVPPGRYGVAVRVKSDTLAEAGLTVLPDPGDDPGLFRRKPGSYDEWLLKKQRTGGWKGE